jgi:sigma-B regulation protein RsbU (phosphoserine phosphatase)
VRREDFRGSAKIPAKAYTSGEFVDVPDLREDAEAPHDRTGEFGIRSAVAVPLRLTPLDVESDAEMGRPRVIGVVYMDRGGRDTLLRSAAREALEVLASEAAVAIENARLYRDSVERIRIERELEFARVVQQALLPGRTQSFPFCEAAGCNVPSRQIGGDFFDCFLRADGSLAFLLGDVAGKGPPAALLAASTHGMLSIFAELSASPAETMGRLNRAFRRRAPEGKFVTLFYGVLRPDGQLLYCNAGHNPPFLLSAGARPSSLETGGLPIGVLESECYEVGEIRLGKGDAVVVYSDGITEAESESGELFGEARLLASLEAASRSDAEDLLEAVLQGVRGFVGEREASDDVTLLVVRGR